MQDVIEGFQFAFNDLKKRNILPAEFDTELNSMLQSKNFIKSMHKTSNRLSPMFVCSFCRAKDDYVSQHGLLSQWRGYGSDGGVAICFDREGLEELIAAEYETYKLLRGYFGDVVYGKEDPEYSTLADGINFFPKAIPDLLEHYLRKNGVEYSFDGDKISIEDLYAPYADVAPRLKHPGFSEEVEYRIVVSIVRGQLDNSDNRRDKQILFRGKDNYFVPYVALDSLKLRNKMLPIRRIIVGPSRESERRMESINLLLKEAGYAAEATLSEIPFA